jgi:hypothetical protein
MVIDPQVAAALLDDVAAVFEGLADRDRREVARLIEEIASTEEAPERRRVLLELPDGLGLVDD